MTLSDEEKIQKAQEIYYRRNGINYRGEKQTVNQPKSHTFRNFLIIILIAVSIYGYQNKEKLQSAEFQDEIKTFLNTKINIKDVFSSQIKEKEPQNTSMQEAQSLLEELPDDVLEIQEYKVIWPYKGEITSSFGARESEDSRVTPNHTGIDIAGNTGDKILSAINGKVTMVSEEGNLGKHIKIEDGEIATVYAHCNNIYISEGDEIKQGQEIGEIGSTGNSTGSHLHFEILKNGEQIDPLTIIEKKVENEN